MPCQYLDPDDEVALLAAAGLSLVARLDREPYPEVEQSSRRSYLTVVGQRTTWRPG